MDLLIIFEPQNLLYTVMVFCSRVVDVSLGTLRTIAIVNGRTAMAFWLGFFESAIWLAVVSTIVQSVAAQPLLGVIYALGFATGNLVGIKLERIVAIGNMVLRVISRENSEEIISQLRGDGFAVTVFTGEGREGTVLEMYIVCRRKDLKRLLKKINILDPHAFYVTERTGDVSKLYRPTMQPATGWRAIMKKK